MWMIINYAILGKPSQMWQITQDEIQQLSSPPGKITKLMINISSQSIENKHEQLLKFIKLANLCYLAEKINKTFDINYIYRLADLRHIIPDVFNVKAQDDIIKECFSVYIDSKMNPDQEKYISQPLLLIDNCENLPSEALTVFWISNSAQKIYETVVKTQKYQCQISEELIMRLLIARNKFNFIFSKKLFKYLDLVKYCVNEQGSIDLSFFQKHFQSLPLNKFIDDAKTLITNMYTNPSDIGNAMSQLISYLEQKKSQTQNSQPDASQFETQDIQTIQKLDEQLDQQPYDEQNTTNQENLPFVNQLEELSQLFHDVLYQNICTYKFRSDYLSQKRQDVDYFFQNFILQLQDQTNVVNNPVYMLNNINFEHLQSCFVSVCLLNEILDAFDDQTQINILKIFLNDNQIDVTLIPEKFQLLLLFKQIKSLLLQNQFRLKVPELYQMLNAMDHNDDIDQYQIEKLIQLLPLTNSPLYNSNRINDLIINLEYMKYILQQYSEESLEEDKEYIITQQQNAIQHLYSSYLPEVTLRMNAHNVKSYYNTIIYYSDQLPVQHTDWIIQYLTQADIPDVLFSLVQKNQLLTIKIIITKLLNILNNDMEEFKQKEVVNGVLNKQYQSICIFMLTLIFQHQYYSDQLVEFFLSDIIQSIYNNIRDYQSYLHLYMLREMLTHIFYKCSSNEQKNRKLTNTIQAQDDAFKTFKNISNVQITKYLQVLLGSKEIQSDNPDQSLVLIKILDLITSQTFIQQLSIKNIHYEELAELIQLTRNDLLFFFSCANIPQDFINNYENHFKNIQQSTNNILFKAILQQKTSKKFAQSVQLFVIFSGSLQDEKIKQHFVSFYSSNKNTTIQEQLFELLLSAPQMYQTNVKEFLLLFVADNAFQLVLDFLIYGYMNCIAMTRNDIENFGKLINEILYNIKSRTDLSSPINNYQKSKNEQHADTAQNCQTLFIQYCTKSWYLFGNQQIYFDVGSDQYETILLLHSYLCVALFENTYSDRVLALHKVVQQGNKENLTTVLCTNRIFELIKDIDETDRSALMKTTILELNLFKLQTTLQTNAQLKNQAKQYISQMLTLSSPYINILKLYIDTNKITDLLDFDE